MRLQISKTKNASSLYIVKSTYDKNGKRSNKIVEKLGTLAYLSTIYDDPIAWGKQRAQELTELEELDKQRTTIEYDPSKRLDKDKDSLFNGGYLFLQSLYYESGLDRICQMISEKYKFEYDLNSILSRLLYGRILFPGSKLSTMEASRLLLETPGFDLHHIYRALEVIAKENDLIQSELYKNSLKTGSRNDSVLYYDCTNFFFEIEEESGLRQYGVSKEHRPNPIVEMGLFMDGDGVPLAFSIHPGNTNEQLTLKPLEEQIIQNFGKKRFVVCTDAGLSSNANRLFNSQGDKSFITVQSIKKMKAFQKDWALDPHDWLLPDDKHHYTLQEIEENAEAFYNSTFFKERWFNENGLEQRFIVTYSLKYKAYTANLRERQLQRAQKAIDTNSVSKRNVNDPKRFVQQLFFTADGEIADLSASVLDEVRIDNEATYDGFYCVATNLEDTASEILKVNRKRWEIEESFRIMKSEFKSRPVYLSRNDRITAHFVTCFLSLYLFRKLEKRLDERFTACDLSKQLRNMRFQELPREGYVPAYRRTDLTDALHEAFGFYTDREFMSLSAFRKIFKLTKKA